jgi:gluconokinase
MDTTSPSPRPQGFVVMGVSGCGKSTIAQAIAERIGWTFHDADDFHPQENVDKMRAGIPLNDGDRWPWLARLNGLLSDAIRSGSHPVLACSALKQAYREKLVAGGLPVTVIYLKGSYEEILARLSSREGHFMPPALLRSQFDALEEPTEAWTVPITLPVDEIVAQIVSRLEA